MNLGAVNRSQGPHTFLLPNRTGRKSSGVVSGEWKMEWTGGKNGQR